MKEAAVLCRTLSGGEELGGRKCVEFHLNIFPDECQARRHHTEKKNLFQYSYNVVLDLSMVFQHISIHAKV